MLRIFTAFYEKCGFQPKECEMVMFSCSFCVGVD